MSNPNQIVAEQIVSALEAKNILIPESTKDFEMPRIIGPEVI